MRERRRRRSEVRGVRLWPDADELLDREAERTGRYPANILSELILVHLAPDQGHARSVARQTADAAS